MEIPHKNILRHVMLTTNCFIIPKALEFRVINTNIFSSVGSIRICYNECFMLGLEDNRKTNSLKKRLQFPSALI